MNFMGYGLPVIAAVNPRSEVARIVERSGGGWIVDSSEPGNFPRTLGAIMRDSGEIRRRGEAARRFAGQNFDPNRFVDSFDRVVRELA
jgi:hypothetical protein